MTETEQTTPTYIPRFGWLRAETERLRGLEFDFEFPTVNVDLLRETIHWVEEEAAKPAPERKWYQASWRVRNLADMLGIFVDPNDGTQKVNCGTACCVAGHAVTIAGAVWLDDETLLADDGDDRWSLQEHTWVEETEDYVKGVDVSTRAERILGLTHDEARALFEGSNTVENIREVAGIVAERAGVTL